MASTACDDLEGFTIPASCWNLVPNIVHTSSHTVDILEYPFYC